MTKEERLIDKFERAVWTLNSVMNELQEIYPEANYYLANDDLCLMRGPSHTDGNYEQTPLRENILAAERLRRSGGGDW